MSFPNVIGIIHKYIVDINKYEIKTKYGIINRIFSSTDFQTCPNLNIDIGDNNEYISLRTLAKLDCIRFIGCKCYGRCQNKVCFCFKNKKLCGNFCKHKARTSICLNTIFKKEIKTRRNKL